MSEAADHFKSDARGNAYAGDHLLVELWDAEGLTDAPYIQDALERAARAAQAHVVHSHYHHFGEGMGVSGVTILAGARLRRDRRIHVRSVRSPADLAGAGGILPPGTARDAPGATRADPGGPVPERCLSRQPGRARARPATLSGPARRK
jgi:hypothetical protein